MTIMASSSASSMARIALPGRLGLGVWLIVTVACPMLCAYALPAAIELNAEAEAVVVWAIPGFFALGIIAGVRYVRRCAPGACVVAGIRYTLVGGAIIGLLYGGVQLLVYRLVIPLPCRPGWILLTAAAAATVPIAGSACGLWLGRRNDAAPDDAEPDDAESDGGGADHPARAVPRLAGRCAVGIVAAALGGWLAGPILAGAVMVSEESTLPINSDQADRYGAPNLIVVHDLASPDTRCHVTTPRPASPVRHLPFRPYQKHREYRGSFVWVAMFTAGPGGPSTATCDGVEDEAVRIFPKPPVRGLAASALTWPLPAIWFCGAIPGLLVLAEATGRVVARRRHRR